MKDDSSIDDASEQRSRRKRARPNLLGWCMLLGLFLLTAHILGLEYATFLILGSLIVVLSRKTLAKWRDARNRP
jgi:hypothetical protein